MKNRILLCTLMTLALPAAFSATEEPISCLSLIEIEEFTLASERCLIDALEGSSEAQLGMGRLHVLGRGAVKSHAEAIRWFMASALQGNPQAQHELGAVYHTEVEEGQRVNYVPAHAWFNIAAANGNTDSEIRRNRVENRMTSDEVIEAQSWAHKCLSSNYIDCQ